MNTTSQHEAFINNPEAVNSLMAHVISNNLDISTQEKFTEAMQSWYKYITLCNTSQIFLQLFLFFLFASLKN